MTTVTKVQVVCEAAPAVPRHATALAATATAGGRVTSEHQDARLRNPPAAAATLPEIGLEAMRDTDVLIPDKSDALAEQRVYTHSDASKAITLGYDWIASVLENASELDQLPDCFFDELREFRRVNHGECVCPDVAGADRWQYHDVSLPRRPAEVEKESKIVGRSYRVNAALTPVELEHRSLPTLPGVPDEYDRVSMPQHHILPELAVGPDPDQSARHSTMNLSQHLVRGWGTARPAAVSPKRRAGLSHAIGHRRTWVDPDVSKIQRQKISSDS
mmetsp:Transcript_6120/g.15628  ORF Transcript_6120/g.15628 Transcript_6120/m.15628 type:complete len:274 (-) Transcript_6120:151-972(-)